MTEVPSNTQLAARMVQSLPGWGRWAEDLRDFETPFGKIGYRQASILFVIRHRMLPPSQRTASNLARYFGIQNSAITRAVDKLVTGDFLDRRPDEDDLRTYHLTLTQQGIAASIWIESMLVDAVVEAMPDLSTSEMAALGEHIDLLSSILARLREPR